MSALPQHEQETLLTARGGDHEAGRRLLRLHGPSMVRTAWSVLGRYGGAEAEDVVQEALIAALSTSALPEGDVGAWLRAITVRKALDCIRRSRRRKEEPLPDPGERTTGPYASARSGALVDILALREALASLGAVDRAVLVLADLEGRSMAEVARTLGSTRVAVKLRASRARRKLARLLAESETASQRPGRDSR